MVSVPDLLPAVGLIVPVRQQIGASVTANPLLVLTPVLIIALLARQLLLLLVDNRPLIARLEDQETRCCTVR